MINKPNIITSIYKLRHDFGIIGLTGRTGSGCSTVADLLCKSGFKGIEAPIPHIEQEGVNNDERKYKIIYTYLNNILKNNKIQFIKIKVSVIILFIVIKDGYDHFLISFEDSQSDKDSEKSNNKYIDSLKKIEEEFNKMHEKAEDYYKIIQSNIDPSKKIKAEIIKFVQDDIPSFQERLNEELKEISIKKLHRPFQYWGNNIRQYGLSYKPEMQNETNNPSLLAAIVDKIIKFEKDINKKHGMYFIIDSLRNPYEVLYFRERYTSFYLMSINTTEGERRKNLDVSDYSKSDVDDLDAQEHPDKRKGIKASYYTQDIEACIELSDIHIAHSNIEISRNFDLKRQLCHYIALMLHPGLVSPYPEERIMQIATTAKVNSGCISRQVGAVVTNERYSVKAIGWNTVAEGQTPCSLRDFNDLCNYCDISAYSPFEYSDIAFRKVVSELQKMYKMVNSKELKTVYGLSHPFCFKDLYTVQMNGQKNQVHTRSLHAEENAFLQLAKYGSEGIKGGKLFTTASCCELCAKKAYQLGIRDIYYIDSYPGISLKHIFMAGTECPNLHLFKGAVGRAYQQLYTPFMSLKDEIEFLTNIWVKDITMQNSKKKEPSNEDSENSKDKSEKY